MEKKVKILSPLLPNYVFDENGNQYDLKKDFTEMEIRELGAEWIEKMVERLRK